MKNVSRDFRNVICVVWRKAWKGKTCLKTFKYIKVVSRVQERIFNIKRRPRTWGLDLKLAGGKIIQNESRIYCIIDSIVYRKSSLCLGQKIYIDRWMDRSTDTYVK